MPLPKSLGGWTFVRHAGTPSEAIVGTGEQAAVPFERLQATGKDLVGLISLFNRFVDNVIRATRGARSIPFGAGGTVLLGVNFVAGTTLVIPHRLGTASLSAIFSVATSPIGTPLATVSFDDKNATFTAGQTWTGDVYILVTA